MNFEFLIDNWRFIARAYAMTALISTLSVLLGAAVGICVGVTRVYGARWVGSALSLYVDSMRAVPVLVLLVWGYLATPVLIGRSVDPVLCAVIVLSLHLGAYLSEDVRGGLTSIRQGQLLAAMSLGMDRLTTIRCVLLPQALIRMLPAIGSSLIVAVKDTAVASVIAVPELMRQSQILAGETFRPLEVYTLALALYVATLYPASIGVERLYRRVAPLGAS